MKIAWNGIVKNEAAIIERCVRSLLPHIDYGIVVDTGSTDGTVDKIQQLFDAAGKPVEFAKAPFHNFEQARNRALRVARESGLDWDYLLLADADMELKVEQPFKLNGGLSYDMRQTTGGFSYSNRRLINRKATGGYVGVTHEYVDVPTAGSIDGAYFIDHADGANRPDKLARDVALLEEALKTETRPGLVERYRFYLANSYFDLKNWGKAAEQYKIRVGLGGYDEEKWYAQGRYAQCLGQLGNHAGFVWEMLQAYHLRPGRTESIYDLAKFFRERGENHTSLLFSEAGMQVSYPKDDLLFVNDWIYKSGLKEEYSICAYYDERKRWRGAKECNKLALEGSEQARGNLYWYLKPLTEHVPSFKPQRIEFQVPEGYAACNPSVINDKGLPLALVRTVNYKIMPNGGYAIRGTDGVYSHLNPIHSRNFLVCLDTKLEHELVLPPHWPEPKYPMVRGLEDSRLFRWKDNLWTISCARELNLEGWCEQVLSTVWTDRYAEWKRISQERKTEKNWMPWIRDGELAFVYRLGTLVDETGKVFFSKDPGFDVGNISGGSQVIKVDRHYLALVHEAGTVPGQSNRYYRHRFVAFHEDGGVDRLSPPFVFHDRTIEFCAGLAYFPNNNQLVASYGINDCEAWLATMNADEVIDFIYRDAP